MDAAARSRPAISAFASSATRRRSWSGGRCDAVWAEATSLPAACVIAPIAGRAAASRRAASRRRYEELVRRGRRLLDDRDQPLDGTARKPAAAVSAVVPDSSARSSRSVTAP